MTAYEYVMQKLQELRELSDSEKIEHEKIKFITWKNCRGVINEEKTQG